MYLFISILIKNQFFLLIIILHYYYHNVNFKEIIIWIKSQ